MSNDFKKVSVIDDRLNTTDSLNYAVFRGGQNVTNVRMPAISATDNNLNFVVPFPSESTILDREVYIKTRTRYLITLRQAASGITINQRPGSGDTQPAVLVGYQCPIVYGSSCSVNSFPTHRTFDTVQVQINNDVQTLNVSDVLPALLRCSDEINWEKTNMTASQIAILSSNNDEYFSEIGNTMAGYDMVQGNKNIPNGSFNATFTPVVSLPTNANDPLIPFDYGSLASGMTGTRFFVIEYTSTEPLLAPPFIWNETDTNRQGIYGIQNMSVICNYNSNVRNAIKWVEDFMTSSRNSIDSLGQFFQPAWPEGISTTSSLPFYADSITQQVVSAELQMKYITPHSNDVKPPRNVIPILQYPRYITQNLGLVDAAVTTYNKFKGIYTFTPSQDYRLVSQTFTFNMIPDKLIIFVRPDSSVRNNPNFNDFAMVIKNISIQWNNGTGILSNCSQEQLFHMSKEAGSNQDWLQFSGIANTVYSRNIRLYEQVYRLKPIMLNLPAPSFIPTPPATIPLQYDLGQGQNLQSPAPFYTQYGTIGSYLMLDMAKHVELIESWNAPGSLGSYQLQFNLTVMNVASVAFKPEIVVIPVNSGIMVTERGQTSSYTGILTKADVLDAALQEPYSHMDIKRTVGRGHGDSSKALPKKIMPVVKSSVERIVGSGKPNVIPKEPKKEINKDERMASRLMPEIELTEDQLLED